MKNLKPKKKKKVQSVIKKKRVKVLTEEFFDWMSHSQWNAPQPFLIKLAERLIYWVENYDTITFGEFLVDHGLSQRQYFDWLPKCPKLQEAHQYALTVIGTRREIKGLTKELDSGSINTTMSMYSKMHKDHAEWNYRMKAAVNAKRETEGTKYIIIDPIKPNSQIEDNDEETTTSD